MTPNVRSTPEAKKAQLIADLTEARRAVLDAARALQSDARDTPFLGAWSAHDVVAHLVGWDYANLEAIQDILAGRLPAFYSHYDPDWRTFNAELVAQHKLKTLEETATAAQVSHAALLAALTAVAAQDVSRDHGVRSARGRRVTIAMLVSVKARDCWQLTPRSC